MVESDWDKIFDELYLRTHAQIADPETGPRQAEQLAKLVGLEPGADVLDCPCGYGRHSIEFARLGLHVVGADRSEVLLAEAKRLAGDAAWPRSGPGRLPRAPLRGRELRLRREPISSSIGYWGEDGDRRALAEFRRVMRPGGSLVIETMHRDRLMAIYVPRDWQDLPRRLAA